MGVPLLNASVEGSGSQRCPAFAQAQSHAECEPQWRMINSQQTTTLIPVLSSHVLPCPSFTPRALRLGSAHHHMGVTQGPRLRRSCASSVRTMPDHSLLLSWGTLPASWVQTRQLENSKQNRYAGSLAHPLTCCPEPPSKLRNSKVENPQVDVRSHGTAYVYANVVRGSAIMRRRPQRAPRPPPPAHTMLFHGMSNYFERALSPARRALSSTPSRLPSSALPSSTPHWNLLPNAMHLEHGGCSIYNTPKLQHPTPKGTARTLAQTWAAVNTPNLHVM